MQHLLDPSNRAAGYAGAPPLTGAQQNLCSAPVDIDLSLGVASRRSASMRIRTWDAGSPRRQNRS